MVTTNEKHLFLPEDPGTRDALIKYLTGFVTENKMSKFRAVLPHRTRHITLALEDIYQPHNASATVRSADLFGIQDLHVIENRNRYTLSPGVSVGASKWVTIRRYNKRGEDNTGACIDDLRERGYRIVATSPHRDEVLLHDLPIDKPLALLFGTEETGLSPTALEMADEFVKIPQVGFTESFNISVSVAVTLYDLTMRLRDSAIDWRLSEVEQQDLLLVWIQKTLARFPQLVKSFLAERSV
jgi:tRNA (guanosine-2'-O-)-methyltransferase